MIDYTIIPVSSVVIISALIYGVFGFGYALICLALLPYFISVKIAVPMIAMQAPFYTGYLLFNLRHHLTLRYVAPLLFGLILGLPLGVNLLRVLSEETIRLFLGAFILLYCFCSTRRSFPARPLISNNAWGLLAGFLSGVVGGAIVASGPIIVTYLTLKGLKKEELKATFLIWAMTMCCLLAPFYALSGVLTYQAFLWGVITIPFAALGLFFGVRLFNTIKEQIFYRLILIFLVFTGIRLLVS
ncbi:MAG: sulfite exporter TauE/SafE family protein [Deltaproteobacteria bacterium]|nr:sulfite exporter TauE/SafE family protein [Deltaproteobacteria bacterium]